MSGTASVEVATSSGSVGDLVAARESGSLEVSAVVGSVGSLPVTGPAAGSFGVSVAAGSVASLELGEFMFPEPVVSLLTTDILLGDEVEDVRIKWRSATLGNDGKIYCVPYAADDVLVLDPVTEIATRGFSAISPVTQTLGSEAQKWVDATLGPNGKIYGNPHYGKGYLIIDPATDPITITAGSPEVGQQLRGGALGSDGKIYGTYHLDNPRFSVMDTADDIQDSSIGPYEIDRTGPYYSVRPNWESESPSVLNRMWGATANSDGSKIYGTPWGADRISICNVGAGTASQGVDTLTGGQPIPTGLYDYNDKYYQKYSGGTLSSLTGNIYCFPRHARTILKINTLTDRATEIPLPSVFDTGNILWSKSFSSVEGSDGRIYSVPWNYPFLFWIDPRSDSIGWMDISDVLSNSGIPGNYYTYGASVGNDIYFIPGSATKILKVTVTP